MLKKEKELRTVPFFWTTMLGKSIRYAGRRGQRGRRADVLITELGLVNAERSPSLPGAAQVLGWLPRPGCDPCSSRSSLISCGLEATKEEELPPPSQGQARGHDAVLHLWVGSACPGPSRLLPSP